MSHSCTKCNRAYRPNIDGPPLAESLQPKYRRGRCPKCRAMRLFKEDDPLVWDPETRQAVRSGEQLKQEGIAKVESSSSDGADAAWKAEAGRVADGLIAMRKEFTIQDITERVGLPINRNVTGAFLFGLARQGKIKRVGYRSGTRSSQHARAVAVWIAR